VSCQAMTAAAQGSVPAAPPDRACSAATSARKPSQGGAAVVSWSAAAARPADRRVSSAGTGLAPVAEPGHLIGRHAHAGPQQRPGVARVRRQRRARQPGRDRLPRGAQIAPAERDQGVDVAHGPGELDLAGGAGGPARLPQLTGGVVVAAAQG
jgi:hypothetical protein